MGGCVTLKIVVAQEQAAAEQGRKRKSLEGQGGVPRCRGAGLAGADTTPGPWSGLEHPQVSS